MNCSCFRVHVLDNCDHLSARVLVLHVHLRNECLFFWVHGEWIKARDKQIAWTAKRFSDDLFVPRLDSFPINPEKKTFIPYIYNVSNKDPSKTSPTNVINSKFPQQRVLNIILCINHCACDLPNCRNYLMNLIIGNWIEKFKQGSTKEIWYHCKYYDLQLWNENNSLLWHNDEQRCVFN